MIIRFDEDQLKALAFDGDDQVGYCEVEEKIDSTWAITHTVVDEEYRGQGIAEDLIDKVCEQARGNYKKILPICSYAVKKFDEEPEKYGDVDARA
ncbi:MULTISPECIES: GNAT family N-acetyltransferase [unclassified Anaerococcus]|uniref:GNAT family N-acetyltransferase n=1 Tax=Anaerococcus martiniensis TaxID=3115615 RepID=A0ABW9M9S1_9FIRM|nr:GNAT family N-acetyltransferase [Anaerococcus sp. Marseille-Q5996]